MGSARKYLALALAACAQRKYEEAGVLLAQASQEDDVEATIQELGGIDAAAVSVPAGEAPASTSASDDFDWGESSIDDEVGESVSSVTRRKTTSLHHIGQILGAVISESSEQEPEQDEDDDLDSESDPDLTGEVLIPASFSSVRVRSAVTSPVKLKT